MEQESLCICMQDVGRRCPAGTWAIAVTCGYAWFTITSLPVINVWSAPPVLHIAYKVCNTGYRCNPTFYY